MKSTKNQYLYIFFLISLLVLFFGFYSNQNNSLTSVSPRTTNKNVQNTSAKKVIDYKNIYYYNQDNIRTDIFKYNGQDNQLIFTDADEKEKISKILGISGNKMYLIMSKNDVNNLHAIDLDASGKKNLVVANFNKENIALGNDSFAYTEYSNAEKSFGYKIFLTNLNGKNKEEIANESLDPFNIIINQKTLYYIIDRSNIFEIYSIDLKNNNKNLIAELNQKPEYFSIHNNIIYFLTENKLYSYAVETKIITEIFIDKIESYYLFNQYIFYTKDGKIFSKLDKENFEIIAGKTLIKVE
ncbi:hypothetical protein COZ61_00595 [Candidatus Berkelbacteria bacterium CG_4_8_14_3_um_filter_33_6]|uniref:DUF5050 domain-containing protein n=1 Tax=Candidatus Berkelbacteria bacterium CG_4_10_14_0_2_um_filter_35_9_33_12 TaxID=1974499 RepID=A0A2M7W4N1_9BACT|nr:MAG: hypothetical protein COX10_00295 [Candidatus Berkelbacteria bacterium CG23_combo_of_CG06-09_8_20_14_all_33_15]PIS08114.1 MAG: hypothetical protein COT76_03080 [Candidatus Berkelbacteria bacterium CG10_big_fil_rev_8_21_14_0_10_33_10]PIX31295.1 MAG: hypothetical protein COZ61_00595 [Candidatus Berkelbacteria bacterium CG_4_8_14_3_um_filter_33_6]PJA20769.1 MAG: hypothetical protein COX60_00800 [Candidatus Berkelbacteria bacterium CG_4_10_14_0_2_um_filter_35_9_33_12]